jgi:hypothetical protein
MMNLPVTPVRLAAIDVLRNQSPDGPECRIQRPSPQNNRLPEYLYNSTTWTPELRLALTFGEGQARRLIADHMDFFGTGCVLVDSHGKSLHAA